MKGLPDPAGIHSYTYNAYKKKPVFMKTRSHIRTALLVALAGIIACLAYDRYQSFSTRQERLREDMSRIETMLSENDATRS